MADMSNRPSWWRDGLVAVIGLTLLAALMGYGLGLGAPKHIEKAAEPVVQQQASSISINGTTINNSAIIQSNNGVFTITESVDVNIGANCKRIEISDADGSTVSTIVTCK